ncbi:hypothetical protein [Streptomyces canus]|uniref:Uncharacterized protein n=1 Tax=Streptomyces canus TaxID=58343 RepID=A0AAW8FAR6_9ACTN|nr:hypothetical protein [Streptomyces canus]MDQ0907217.1 hypothetical protein [Streptomyces canus]MDQ1067229.1 hypothetical protein [Streptomyces canus]
MARQPMRVVGDLNASAPGWFHGPVARLEAGAAGLLALERVAWVTLKVEKTDAFPGLRRHLTDGKLELAVVEAAAHCSLLTTTKGLGSRPVGPG